MSFNAEVLCQRLIGTVFGWPIRSMLIEQLHIKKNIRLSRNNEDSTQAEIIGTSDALNSPAWIINQRRRSRDPPGLILSIISAGPNLDQKFLVIIDKRNRNGLPSGEIYRY